MLLVRSLEANPDDADGWALMARLSYDLQDPSRTIHCLEQVLRIEPDNIRAQEHLHYLTGQVYTNTSLPDTPAVVLDDPPVPRQPRRLRRAALAAAVLFGFGLLLIAVMLYLPVLQAIVAPVLGQTASANSPSGGELPGYTVPFSQPFGTGISRQISRFTGRGQAAITAPTPTPIPPPAMVDYSPMYAELEYYVRYTVSPLGFDLGIAFVDIDTGQVVSLYGDQRFHAMSTFKGPLAAYYWWLLERGMLAEQPGDREHIANMLEFSANTDTACVFRRVGGIIPFNDWLAAQGFSRDNNFVLKWQEWDCTEAANYTPPIDWRYSRGDETLGLPGNQALLACPVPQLPCDKAFAPAELANFYARLYRGEVIGPAYRDLLLPMMLEGPAEAIFLNDLPDGAQVAAYIKGGTYEATEEYRVNFISEAGIIETERGAFAFAMFQQQYPDWPGTGPMSHVARIMYDAYMETHLPAISSGE